jgi:hypothetical protein
LLEPLQKRIDVLERSLDRATKDVARLKSQVATLVGASRDIKKPSGSRVLPAIAGIVFGIALSASMWIYGTSAEPIMVRAPAPTPPAVEPPAPAVPIAAAPVEVPAPIPVAMRVASTSAQAPARDESRAAARSIPYVGTLSIDASPGGEVFLNRAHAGHTPLRLEHLKAGSHLVWIEHDGYRRWTKVVEVPADRVSRVFADLEPIPPR